MAEGIARNILGAGAAVESAGVEAGEDMPATQHALAVMAERGIDISDHRSRPVESVNLSLFDVVIAMTSSIAETLRRLGVEPARVQSIDVDDPYCKGLAAYRTAAEQIERGLRRVLLGNQD